jgi:hypothetical protein
MRFNEDWLINQYEKRIKTYENEIKNCTHISESETRLKYRALIIATKEFIKDLKELKESKDV